MLCPNRYAATENSSGMYGVSREPRSSRSWSSFASTASTVPGRVTVVRKSCTHSHW